MKIIVCMKQVPVQDSLLKIAENGRWILEDELNWEINESDHYALETALRLKEANGGGEVVLLTMGPDRVKEAIKQGLAKGADRALHLNNEAFSTIDPFINAKLLAAAIKNESPDLVFTGLQTDDQGWGQTGPALAEMLGFSHATIAMEIVKTDAGVKVKRELESGWFQWVELPAPALVSIQSGISQLRYATIKGIMMAKKKEIKQLTLADIGLSETEVDDKQSPLKFDKIYMPEKNKQAELLTGDPKEIARQLADKLKNEAKVF